MTQSKIGCANILTKARTLEKRAQWVMEKRYLTVSRKKDLQLLSVRIFFATLKLAKDADLKVRKMLYKNVVKNSKKRRCFNLT